MTKKNLPNHYYTTAPQHIVGERVRVLGDAGQPVPVPVQAAEERFGKHTLQLYCIQCTLVFSLRLERVLHRTEDIILYICKR